MSNNLIPITVSSQLDLTGEERIHAAIYDPTASATTPVIIPSTVACAIDNFYTGGQNFPTSIPVNLGTQLGTIHFLWGPAAIPDKAEVWYNREKVIDTGYVGDTSYQAALDVELTNRGVPTQTITQSRGGNAYRTVYDMYSFQKTSTNSFAEIRVYGPLSNTGWSNRIQCSNASPVAEATEVCLSRIGQWDCQQLTGTAPNLVGPEYDLLNTTATPNQVTLSLTNLPASCLFSSAGDLLYAHDFPIPPCSVGNKDLSMWAWVRLNTVGTTIRTIIDLVGGHADGTAATYNSQGSIKIDASGNIYHSAMHAIGVEENVTFAGSTLSANTNYFIAVTRNATTKSLKLYINGALIDTKAYVTAIDGGDNSTFKVGNTNDTPGTPDTTTNFNGYICGAGVGSTVLSQAAITYLYNGGAGRNNSQIVADAGWPN